MSTVHYARTGDKITIFLGTDFYEVEDTEENRELFIPLAKENKTEELQELLDQNEDEDVRVVLNADDRFERDPESGRIYLAGTERPVPRTLADRIRQSLDEGYPIEAEVNFWKNCLLNPEPSSVDQLWNFTQEHNVPLTHQGLLLCYKKVRTQPYYDTDTGEEIGVANRDGNLILDGPEYDALSGQMRELALSDEMMFVDIYSGDFNNSVGQIVSMPREDVVNNPNKACAPGLHTASMEYIPHYGTNGNISAPEGKDSWEECSLTEIHDYLQSYDGDPIVEVLVNPRHVVSVPHDHDHAKIRTCQYFVYGLFNGERNESYVPQDYIDRDSENLREDLEAEIEAAAEELQKAKNKRDLASHLQ